LNPRFGGKIQARLFRRLIRHHGFQIADASVGENDQVAMAMHVAGLNEPWLARPLMGGPKKFPFAAST